MGTENGMKRDTEFMAVQESISLMVDSLEHNDPDAVLMINLSGKTECAILGGSISPELVDRFQALVDELKARAAKAGTCDKVFHVWR
ncbi:hypothetical protein [Pseudomonas typographi]|uniref:hypothetical protein n=1 Tax=Pseudomonas typographi TaxID=2715964 RepID=UPI0016842580|nr:hypothetical protein [Pseudomonas typographi]MBD1554791.1 hypothetical protein [Pseudomonas typographi]